MGKEIFVWLATSKLIRTFQVQNKLFTGHKTIGTNNYEVNSHKLNPFPVSK